MDFYEYEELCEEENRQNLQHHGIFGQKWGIRRYQNSDGSLTEEGKKRYNKSDSPRKERKAKDKKQKRQEAPKRTVHDLTNEELRQRTERMRLENEFMNKYYEQMRYENKANVRRGSDWLKTAATVTASVGTVLFTADKIAKMFGVDIGQMAKDKFSSELRKEAENKYGVAVRNMDLGQLKEAVERDALETKYFDMKKKEFR